MWLNLNQSPDELNDLHRRDYYWYLRSPEFVEAFLKPIAEIVNTIGLPVLDVGCADGILSDFVEVPYIGFDGSLAAVQRGKSLGRKVRVERLDSPGGIASHCGTIVFGGILEVLIKPERRVAMLCQYREWFRAQYFIVYDLERLDASELEKYFHLVSVHHAVAKPPAPPPDQQPIEAVKLARKVMVFR